MQFSFSCRFFLFQNCARVFWAYNTMTIVLFCSNWEWLMFWASPSTKCTYVSDCEWIVIELFVKISKMYESVVCRSAVTPQYEQISKNAFKKINKSVFSELVWKILPHLFIIMSKEELVAWKTYSFKDEKGDKLPFSNHF